MKEALGTKPSTSSNPEAPISASLLPLMALMASGVLSSTVSRFSEVMVTRSRPAVASADWAKAWGAASDMPVASAAKA